MDQDPLEIILGEPGPGQYHCEMKRSNSGYAFGPPSPTTQRGVGIPDPGPGEYEVRRPLSKQGGAFSYAVRQTTATSSSPGPKYDLPPAVGGGQGSVSFGTASQRPPPTTLSNRTPGPQYFVKDSVAKPASPSVSFGTSKRPPLSLPTAGQAAPYRIGAGTGTAGPVSPIKKSAPAFSFGVARDETSRKARALVNTTPGPGEYDYRAFEKSASPSATIGGGRGRKKGGVRQSDIGPGPGEYATTGSIASSGRGPSFGRAPRDRKARIQQLLKERKQTGSFRADSVPMRPDSPSSSTSSRPRTQGRRRRA